MNFYMILYISLDVNEKLNVSFSSNKISFVKKNKKQRKSPNEFIEDLTEEYSCSKENIRTEV